jgi:hypothetical protein
MWPKEPPTEKSGRIYRPEDVTWDCGCPSELHDFASAILTVSGVRRWRHDKCSKYVGVSRESNEPRVVGVSDEYLKVLNETRFF